ncbi:hypothetical protein [Mesoterricola silvestris]|uniref:hypothetical protein n=1 Tax=Mesoterricola silvestris TaxID=2927979 RepID=UPI0029310128|nr:hypothetical protein [Mesoterricola silvestris]
MTTRLQKAADALAARLMVWKKLHAYHREVGDEDVTLVVPDLWSPSDQSAMDEYESAKAEAMGQRPLFKETA